MRFLCRLNYHKWGRWSAPWYRTANCVDRFGHVVRTEYRVYRTLMCQSCGHQRSNSVGCLSKLGDIKYNIEPTWE